MQQRLTQRISLIILFMAVLVGVLNLLDDLLLRSMSWADTLMSPQVWLLFATAGLFAAARYLKDTWTQWLQIGVIILLSGPMTLNTPFTFFGMWFFLLGLVLLYKYGFLNRCVTVKLGVVTAYFLPFLLFSVLNNEGTSSSVVRVANYLIFLTTCAASLYFIFEQQIRDLLASHKTKDKVLAEQAAEIARLEPLSVLGERVANVAHSFKNNLTQLSTALFYLEHQGDVTKAATKLYEFSRNIDERIENILMFSRAGAVSEVETYDACRVIAGLQQIYLSEKAFTDRAQVEVILGHSMPITSVRWDFILMVENILKNALDALITHGVFGVIRIELRDGTLVIGNNGGAMETCVHCHASCLDCPKWGRPGRTNKVGGTGHGLAQVFGTCRKYSWSLKIHTEGDWTFFKVGLGPQKPQSP